MKILITGGTGFIGQELREKLLREGNHIVVVTRNPEKYAGEVASNHQFISWESDMTVAMNEADVVINLAGESIFSQRWTEEIKERIYNSRIDTTRKLVDGMREAENKPALFISASASGFYGNKGDTILDESAPAEQNDFLAKVCIDWELEAQKAAEFGVRVVNPRIGIVLEEGGGALEKMLTPFRFFVGGPIGDGKQYMSWIHRTDLCEALAFPISKEEISGAYNVCAPNPSTMNDFADSLGSILNRPSIFRVPSFVLDFVLGEAAKPVLYSARMQPKKLQQAGFEFHFEELEEALADIV